MSEINGPHEKVLLSVTIFDITFTTFDPEIINFANKFSFKESKLLNLNDRIL